MFSLSVGVLGCVLVGWLINVKFSNEIYNDIGIEIDCDVDVDAARALSLMAVRYCNSSNVEWHLVGLNRSSLGKRAAVAPAFASIF